MFTNVLQPGARALCVILIHTLAEVVAIIRKTGRSTQGNPTTNLIVGELGEERGRGHRQVCSGDKTSREFDDAAKAEAAVWLAIIIIV